MMPQAQLIKLVEKITKSIDGKACNYQQLRRDVDNYAKFVKTLHTSVAQSTLPFLVTPFLDLHSKQEQFHKFPEAMKIQLLNVLSDILSRTRMNNENGFIVLFDFLLVQIVNQEQQNTVSLVTSEEHKLAVLTCMENLFTFMSWDLFPVIYTAKYVPMMRLFLRTCLDILKADKNKALRLSALESVMKCAKIDDTSDFDDVVLLSQVSDILIDFLPGIAARLVVIAVDDQKCGHRIVTGCVKAWARFVSLLLRNYDPVEEPPKLEELLVANHEISNKKSNEIHDEKLALCADLLMGLTAHEHATVRHQLAMSSKLLIDTVFLTLPATSSKIIEILIVLNQDTEHKETAEIASAALADVTNKLIEDTFRTRTFVDNLHQLFHRHLTHLPNVFNGLNTRDQLTDVSLLTGYLQLFAQSSQLKSVLFNSTNLYKLIGCLLYVAEVDKSDVSGLEEHKLHDWKDVPDCATPWKRLKCNNIRIQEQLESAAHHLAQSMIADIVLDYLLDVYHHDVERKAEATLLMNEILSVARLDKAKDVMDAYLDPHNWQLTLSVGNGTSLKDVQINIIQLCLQLEGIGKIALAYKEEFQLFLLRVLYAVLERAGSAHPLLQSAGLVCTANISMACGYTSVTDLINRNADYFAYNVTNKLRRRAENASVLSVLTVVMRHSNMEVLPSIADIIEGVLLQSCDKFQDENAAAYLQVFAAFIKSLHAWLNVCVVIAPVITKREQEEKQEVVRRLQWEELNKPVDLSDDIMEGTADDEIVMEEELNDDNNQPEEFVKPPPPKHIQLLVKILERSLHFLPAKNTNCKIFVLEILTSGVEVLKDYEDELLPIVHKVWSPLVNRFRDFDSPLVVNLSFILLSTLGRLSKDFIRMRTVKEVLPSINQLLIEQSKESYLKDRGSAYRYTQAYKMQMSILTGSARLAYDLELDEKIDIILPGIEEYLCSKQPVPLQEAAMNFYRHLHHFDPDYGTTIIRNLNERRKHDDWNRNLNILLSITQVH